MGLAKSRGEARQLVSHNHFLVNKKPVNIPSYHAGMGTKIALKQTKENKDFFKNLKMTLKNYQPPAWLKINPQKIQGEVIGEPSKEDVDSPVDISSIFEFYSR